MMPDRLKLLLDTRKNISSTLLDLRYDLENIKSANQVQ